MKNGHLNFENCDRKKGGKLQQVKECCKMGLKERNVARNKDDEKRK